ncbi:MAG: AAA family ATPase [Rhodomicrobium sp.]
MRIIALAQQKGGVGKSTAAINLACRAHAEGEKAVLIDMDTEQGSSLKWGQRRKGQPPKVITADASNLPSTLAKLRQEGYTWAFVDLPGRNAPAANAGLAAADFALVPCRPVSLDVEASVATVQSAVRAKKPYAYLLSIVLAHLDKQRARRFAEELKEAGQSVCPVMIVQRVIVSDTIADGLCTCEADAKGESAKEFAQLFSWLKEQLA